MILLMDTAFSVDHSCVYLVHCEIRMGYYSANEAQPQYIDDFCYCYLFSSSFISLFDGTNIHICISVDVPCII